MWSTVLLLGPAVGWLGLFFLAPLGIILLYSFAQRSFYGGVQWNFHVGNYIQLLDPLYFSIYWRSLIIATATTLICLVICYPVAYYIAVQSSKKWKNLLLLLCVVPFWTGFLLRTYAWVFLLRAEGFINSLLMQANLIDRPLTWLLYSDFAVLVGQVYGEIPFMILPLYVSLERLDIRLVEAAMDLGANRWSAFFRVVVPLTKVGIITAIVLVFIPSLGAFITPDLLGGAKSAMVGNVIQNQFVQRNQPLGSALSVLLTIVILVLLIVAFRSGPRSKESAQ
ncbi:MAG: ABC transporter permease [Acidobacteriota bacterium]|nr:ABC transporter permease [Blastocatellia bacterium]MDW8241139.1 ABC transporter permease [Acidobacteriota bacterium]